MTNKYEL